MEYPILGIKSIPEMSAKYSSLKRGKDKNISSTAVNFNHKILDKRNLEKLSKNKRFEIS